MAIELASLLRPAVVAALPGAATKGDCCVLSGDGHLYTYDGAAWVDNGASGGGGGSLVLPQATNTQADWYIDAVGGSDANSGLTSGAALATWAELGKRLNGRRLPQQTIVHVLSDTPASDPIYLDICLDAGGGYFAITGADGVVTTARAGSAAAALDAPSNARATVTAPVGFPLAPGQLIRGSNGAFHWVHKTTGLVAGLDAGCDVDLVPPTFSYPGATLPPTNGYDEWHLPRVYPGLIRVTQYRSGQAYLLIDALDIGTDGALDLFEPTAPTLGFAVMTRCRVRSLSSGFLGGAGWYALKCYFDYLSAQSPASNGFYNWCTLRATEVYAGSSATFADCTFAGTAGGSRYNEALKLMPGATAVVQNCGFFDGAANGIVLSPFSNLKTLGVTYGSNNGGSGVLLGGGAQLAFTQRPTIAGATAAFRYTDNPDTTAKSWAALALTATYTLVQNRSRAGGSVTLDFGAQGGFADVTIPYVNATAADVVTAQLAGTTTEHSADEHALEDIDLRVAVYPGEGYAIFGNVRQGTTHGTFNVNWAVV